MSLMNVYPYIPYSGKIYDSILPIENSPEQRSRRIQEPGAPGTDFASENGKMRATGVGVCVLRGREANIAQSGPNFNLIHSQLRLVFPSDAQVYSNAFGESE